LPNAIAESDIPLMSRVIRDGNPAIGLPDGSAWIDEMEVKLKMGDLRGDRRYLDPR
jgi:hypothetical protein